MLVVYTIRLNISKDPTQSGHSLFVPLPSGKRYRATKACTNRLKKSFFPRAVAIITPHPPIAVRTEFILHCLYCQCLPASFKGLYLLYRGCYLVIFTVFCYLSVYLSCFILFISPSVLLLVSHTKFRCKPAMTNNVSHVLCLMSFNA